MSTDTRILQCAPRAPSRTSSPGAAWCSIADGGARRSTPASRGPTPPPPMTSGAPTSRASSAPGTGATASRSPSRISTRASCSPATASCPPRRSPRARSLNAPSATTACRLPSVPTTECPLPRRPSRGCPTSTPGGCGSDFPQLIRPGCPQENGAHERMHRRFKHEAIKPVRHSCRGQQRNFDAFQREYNTERPHGTLGQHTPASREAHLPGPTPTGSPARVPGAFPPEEITPGEMFWFHNRLCTSPTPWSINTLILKKPTTASGPITLTRSCWRPSTSATTASLAD